LSKYDQRGVSSNKHEVHAAIKNLDKGLYPNAFCKIMPDIVAGDDAYCNLMHADTAGTKTSLAYLYWRETGDLKVWKQIVQDAIVMNTDDMACVGCFAPIILSSTIGRNKFLITGEVVKALIEGTSLCIENLSKHGVELILSGGETADVSDIVRTIDVGFTAFSRLERNKILENNIRPGCVIVGLSSSGLATYESEYNSGIGSNGLTSARHDVLGNYYFEHHKEAFDAYHLSADLAFTGSKKLTDTFESQGMTYEVGQLLLSPTRTYMPVLKKIFKEYFPFIQGVIHCTGGGQTKVMKFVDKVKVIKDNLFEIPPVFQLIQQESCTGLKEMYQVFNMGHRMELYVEPQVANELIAISQSFGIDAKIVGRVEEHSEAVLELYTSDGVYEYLKSEV